MRSACWFPSRFRHQWTRSYAFARRAPAADGDRGPRRPEDDTQAPPVVGRAGLRAGSWQCHGAGADGDARQSGVLRGALRDRRQGAGAWDATFRLGGLVEAGLACNASTELGHPACQLPCHRRQPATVSVVFTGILPDLFREGQGVVALGAMLPGRRASAPPRYWPNMMRPICRKDVADALKKSGKWNPSAGQAARGLDLEHPQGWQHPRSPAQAGWRMIARTTYRSLAISRWRWPWRSPAAQARAAAMGRLGSAIRA